MKTKNNNSEKTKAFTIRVPEDVVTMLDQFAEENHWSRNTAAIVIFEQQLKEKETYAKG
jgi:predicted transcriptional regulator